MAAYFLRCWKEEDEEVKYFEGIFYNLQNAEAAYKSHSRESLPEIVWMQIIDSKGHIYREHHNVALLSFLNKAYNNRIDLSNEFLAGLAANNKPLFDKYLEFIANKTLF